MTADLDPLLQTDDVVRKQLIGTDRKAEWTEAIVLNKTPVENSNTLFLFEKYGLYQKNFINKIILFFDSTMISQSLVQIGPLVTEIQNVWKKYVHFYLMPIYSKTIANIQKSSQEK